MPAMPEGSPGSDLARLGLTVVLWAVTFHLLSRYGVDLLPEAVARQTTLEAYLAGVQLLTLAMGLGLSHLLLREPRRDLALVTSSRVGLGVVFALSPALFAGTTTAAFFVARPTLLAELLAGGRQLAQSNSGEFGRALTHSPALLTILWGAWIAPVGEELFFRGALWSFVQRLVDVLRPPGGAASRSGDVGAEEDLPQLPIEGSVAGESIARALGWLRSGGVATLIVALAFGLLHRDMPGGLGIVRFVSALGLGLACGVIRHHTGSVVPPITLHVVFNALSVATVRRWVVTGNFPIRYGAPTLVSAVGFVALVCVVAFGVARRRHADAGA